jgi:hypothetical protein
MKSIEVEGTTFVKDYTKRRFSFAWVGTVVMFVAVAIFLYAGWCAGCVISYMPHSVLSFISF